MTHDVYPPYVLPISKSLSLNPNSTNCSSANYGWSSKSSTLFIKAASPPAMNETTLFSHSLNPRYLHYCLQSVYSTSDNLPVAPHPQMKTLPPLYRVSLTYWYIFSISPIFPLRIFIVSKSISLMVWMAVGRSSLAISDKPMVVGFCCSVRRHPSLNLWANERKSSAVYVCYIIEQLQYCYVFGYFGFFMLIH